MGQFLADVNARDGAAVARFFDASGFLWEVNQHMNPPNGTAGGLRTVADIAAFMTELEARGDRWTNGSLASPAGTANLPEQTGYGLHFTIADAGKKRLGGAKVVMTCSTGLITHMAGPNG